MDENKILKAVNIMLQPTNQEKIHSIKEIGTGKDFKFKYKNNDFEIWPYSSFDDYSNNEVVEYSLKIIPKINPDRDITYTTEQKELWTDQAKKIFEKLFITIESKYYKDIDEIIDDILKDEDCSNDPDDSDEIPF